MLLRGANQSLGIPSFRFLVSATLPYNRSRVREITQAWGGGSGGDGGSGTDKPSETWTVSS